ncbi:hypothetical protein BaRGS_00035808 [Batillaria attramentaria]|uniref:VWFC domain-containing protein n=1 Tax=Batillaria attramentaria TaxID=370345 RepID=A0ABD0JDH2_9CAEN
MSPLLLLSLLASFVVAAHSAIITTPALAAGCEWQGKWYAEGQQFNPDPCTFCNCQNGRAMCAVADCMMPACVDSKRDPTQCCPVCPNGNNCRAPDGTIIPAGQEVQLDAHTTCRCSSQPFLFTGDAVCTKTVSRNFA